MTELKKDSSLGIAEISEKLHYWYAKDRTQSTQKELLELLKTLT